MCCCGRMTGEFFIPPELCNGYQLAFLTCVYGYVLFAASSMISDGSELLLLVPSIAGLVGSVVLPVLGAVPDSLMVLFSGMSANPQETVAVGVGALAGSTIMLLTVPWFLSVLGGRVELNKRGLPEYANKNPQVGFSLRSTGVANTPLVKKNGVFMLASASLYLVIQVPSFAGSAVATSDAAAVGCLLGFLGFVFYVFKQYRDFGSPVVAERVVEARIAAIRNGEMSLLGAMKDLIEFSSAGGLEEGFLSASSGGESAKEMKALLLPFFKEYEESCDDQRIGIDQFRVIVHDLRLERLTGKEIELIFNSADADRSGHIDFDEFVSVMLLLVRDFELFVNVERFYGRAPTPMCEAENEEAEEMPEDLRNFTPEQQQTRVKLRAARLMILGTLLVLVFTDPAVEVMTEIAGRVGVNPFYVSFVLAPLASNASEVIAAYNYAQRRSKKSIQVSLTTLEGAACLNNTFCLSIFLGIVYCRGLQWVFTAEVISILSVQIVVAWLVWQRPSFRLLDGLVILALYPLSLLLVGGLKRMGLN